MQRTESNGWEPLGQMIPADLLKAEVQTWSKRIGVKPREVHVRPMIRKWASCSSQGRVTLSSDLLRQPAAFPSEVTAHELLHPKVPNHGRLFRNLLRAHLSPLNWPTLDPNLHFVGALRLYRVTP